jgi:hypothetical protein
MTQTLIRRVAIAGALTAVLTLASPAHAAGWGHRGAPDVDVFNATWRWVVSLWTPQASAPRSAGKPTRTTKSDRGASLDPNGGQNPSAATCQQNCDRSSGIDPNG